MGKGRKSCSARAWLGLDAGALGTWICDRLSDLARQRPLPTRRGKTRCDAEGNRHARTFEADDGRLEISAHRLTRDASGVIPEHWRRRVTSPPVSSRVRCRLEAAATNVAAPPRPTSSAQGRKDPRTLPPGRPQFQAWPPWYRRRSRRSPDKSRRWRVSLPRLRRGCTARRAQVLPQRGQGLRHHHGVGYRDRRPVAR